MKSRQGSALGLGWSVWTLGHDQECGTCCCLLLPAPCQLFSFQHPLRTSNHSLSAQMLTVKGRNQAMLPRLMVQQTIFVMLTSRNIGACRLRTHLVIDTSRSCQWEGHPKIVSQPSKESSRTRSCIIKPYFLTCMMHPLRAQLQHLQHEA